MWDRSANVLRLAPLEIANSIKARTAPAATVSSCMAQAPALLQRAVMTLMRGVIPTRNDPCYGGRTPMLQQEGREIRPAMSGWTGARPVRATARWAAALNIFSAVPDGFSVSILRKLVVRGDAAATAANILGSEGLFRLGFVADLFALLFFIASAVLLYEVFRPASRRAALLFLVLMAMGTISQALESVHDLAALVLLKGGVGMIALPSAQS